MSLPSADHRQKPSPVLRLAELAGKRWLAALVLAFLTLIAVLPGQGVLPPLDRDEPRFAQATKQMLETGDFVDIRFQDEARHNKPVGIYWMQSGVVSVAQALGFEDARRTIALYRAPSVLGAVGAVLLTYWAGLPLVGPVAAFLGAAGLALSILLGVEARIAKTDAMLLLTIVAAQGALARAYLAQGIGVGWRTGAVFWAAMAASILIKGPIGPMVVALTIAALWIADRRAGWVFSLKPLPGFLFMMALVAPWFVAIAVQSGGGFFTESVGGDLAAKVATGQESHGGPPGLYALVFWGTFWPVAPFFLLALPMVWQSRKTLPVRFLLAWIVPTWLVFEIVATKLPHYVMPVYPAIALLAGLWLAARLEGGPEAGTRHPLVRLAGVLLAILAGIILPVVLIMGVRVLDGYTPWLFLPFALVCAILALLAARAFWQAMWGRAALLHGATALVLYAGVFGFGFPNARALWVSSRLADAVVLAPCADPMLATVGYREPSLVFLTRTDLVMTDSDGAADFLSQGNCRVAFVERRQEEAFLARLSNVEAAPSLLTRVRGVAINGGRRLDIGVYAVP